MRIEMNREIKVIKRAVRNLQQVEREEVLSPARNRAEAASPLQLARTIEEWVRMHRQKAREELLAARSFKNGALITDLSAS